MILKSKEKILKTCFIRNDLIKTPVQKQKISHYTKKQVGTQIPDGLFTEIYQEKILDHESDEEYTYTERKYVCDDFYTDIIFVPESYQVPTVDYVTEYKPETYWENESYTVYENKSVWDSRPDMGFKTTSYPAVTKTRQVMRTRNVPVRITKNGYKTETRNVSKQVTKSRPVYENITCKGSKKVPRYKMVDRTREVPKFKPGFKEVEEPVYTTYTEYVNTIRPIHETYQDTEIKIERHVLFKLFHTIYWLSSIIGISVLVICFLD